LGYVQRSPVVRRQLDAHPTAEGRRAPAQIEGDVEDCPANATHDLHLGVRRFLIVKSAQGSALAIAGKTRLCDSRLESVGARITRTPDASEGPPRVFVGVYIEKVDAGELGRADNHW